MRATVFTTTNRIEAQALVALLRGEGIDAELAGVVDAARIGVGEGALPVRIEVDEDDEAKARELLATPPPTLDPQPALRPRKSPLVALGIPVVWPGLAHVYAGRPWTGALLGLGFVASLVAAVASSELGAAWLVLFVLDAGFGRRAVLAFNRGAHQSVGRQVLTGVVMVLGAFVLVGARPAYEGFEREASRRELARVKLRCAPGRVALINVADAPRDVEVVSVKTVRQGLMLVDDDGREVETRGERRRALGPNDALELELDAPPPSFEIALLAPPRRELRVTFIVRRAANAIGVRGSSWCDPAP